MVENLNVGVYRNTNDIDGHFIQVNPAFVRMFGYDSESEIMPIKVSDLYYTPQERQFFVEEINQNGFVLDKELHLKKKNNDPIYVSVSAQAHYNKNGTIDWIDGIIEDITERKDVEKRLKIKAKLLNLTHDAIFTRDLDDRITLWNLAAEKTYGWSQEEALGRKIHELLHTQFTTPLNQIKSEVLNQGHWEGDLTHTKRDGSKIIVSSRWSIQKNEDGKHVGFLEVNNDITQRKKVEEELKLASSYNRNLIEASIDPLVTIGLDGKITDANKATETVTGYSRDKLIGTKFCDYFTESEKGREVYELVFKEGSVRDYSLEILNKNGQVTPVLYNASVYTDKFGTVAGALAAARDITELQRIENVMQARLRLLEFAETHSMDELIVATLDEIEALTGSTVGFYVLLESDQRTVTLKNWSTNTQKMCRAEGKGSQYDISKAGVWVDCVYKRHPIIHNDYESLPHKKGLPEGHIPLTKELVFPIKRGKQIKAIIGVGNKSTDYDENDIEIVSQLGDLSWDITERKKAEEKILAAEERYRSIVQHLNDGFIIHDFKGNIFDCNENAARMFGSTKKDLIGSHLNELSTVTTPNFSERMDQLIKTGFFEFDGEYVRENGSILYFNVKSNIVSFEGDGRIQSFIRDTTKHTLAEKALKESEEKAQKRLAEIEAIYNSAPIGLCVLDSDLRFVRINNRLAEINGFSVAEHVGKTVGEIVPDLEEQAVAVAQELVETGNTVMGREFNGMTPAQPGVIRTWIEQWYPIKDSNGQILGINVAVLEVTEIKKAERALRESEEKLRLAIAGAEAGMWFWDLKNNDLEWTDRCNSIFSIEKDSEISYDLFLDAVHPSDRKMVNNAFKSSLDTINELKLEIRLLWPDGSLHWAYLIGTVYHDGEGNPKEMMGIVIDITDRKSIEAELRDTLKQLKRSNAELEQFAYVASHDLQEPLRMVTSFLQLLQRRYENQLDSDADEFIHFAVDGATRMQELINDLLTYSRVGRKTGQIEDVDTEEIIKQIVFDSKVLIEETNTAITYEDLPIIKADYTQMVQVFQNLIGNAIKYQENKQPEIHISAKKSGNDWIFKVEDNGIGIDPKHGDRVFRIFQRLHGRDEYEGTGIGLAIVRRIIEQNGGMIWYESAPGEGTKFYFTIPRRED